MPPAATVDGYPSLLRVSAETSTFALAEREELEAWSRLRQDAIAGGTQDNNVGSIALSGERPSVTVWSGESVCDNTNLLPEGSAEVIVVAAAPPGSIKRPPTPEVRSVGRGKRCKQAAGRKDTQPSSARSNIMLSFLGGCRR